MKKLLLLLLIFCSFLRGETQNIIAAEYFIDIDPGFGNALPVSISPSANIANATFNADFSSVPPGIHRLFLRTLDANGKWSATVSQMLYKTFSVSNLVKAEYFIDSDPGFGSATPITIPQGSTDLANIQFDAALSSVAKGFHRLYVRTRDSIGQWSFSASQLFYRLGGNAQLQPVTAAEYFIDNDPGHGLANPISITPGTDVVNVQFDASISSAAKGFHRLYIRTRDASGIWSHTANQLFYKFPSQGQLPPITDVEYFIDTDPGFGKAVPVAMNPTTNIVDSVFPINISGLTNGNHRFYIRTKDANGAWSLTNDTLFKVSATAVSPSVLVNKVTQHVMCSGDTLRISYHARGTYTAGNVFNAELSDASGSFASPLIIGSVTSTSSAIIYCTLPRHVPDGSGYKVRVSCTTPTVVGLTAADVLTIYNRPELGNDTTVYIICANEKVNLTTLYTTTGLIINWNTGNPTSVGPGNYRLIVTNSNGCTDTADVVVKQDIAIWTGTTNTDWNMATNWSSGMVPDAKTHVIIPSGLPACIISTADNTAASVQPRSGSTFIINTGRTLTITSKCNPLPN